MRRIVSPYPHSVPVARKQHGQRGAPGTRTNDSDTRRCAHLSACFRWLVLGLGGSLFLLLLQLLRVEGFKVDRGQQHLRKASSGDQV